MLEEKWGVSAAAPVAVAAGPRGRAARPEAAEEKTEFDVILAAIGDKKIQVIKEVRAITGLGLKEAKELVDGAPKPVKEGVAKDEADRDQEEARGGAGAKVDVKYADCAAIAPGRSRQTRPSDGLERRYPERRRAVVASDHPTEGASRPVTARGSPRLSMSGAFTGRNFIRRELWRSPRSRT